MSKQFTGTMIDDLIETVDTTLSAPEEPEILHCGNCDGPLCKNEFCHRCDGGSCCGLSDGGAYDAYDYLVDG